MPGTKLPPFAAGPFGRRLFLQGGAFAVATFAGASLPGFASRALAAEPALGTAPGRTKTLVFLFLRGALDGLSAVAPYGDARYAALRPTLSLAAPGAQKKSGQAGQEALLPLGVPGFGLHPSLEPLLPHWREGTLAFVHAVGTPEAGRSHFDSQDFLELGTPGVKSTREGWLARGLLQAVPPVPDHEPLSAIALAARLPRSLQGAPDALAFSSLDQLRVRPLAGMPGGDPGRAQARKSFEALYASAPDEAIDRSGREAFAALGLLDRKLGLHGIPPADGVNYPPGPLGNSLKQVAQLIKAEVGLRVACVDSGGWDTHLNQPNQLQRGLGELGRALASFQLDLGNRAGDVTLVAATEFGRTAKQNGANGTDHGHGSVAFVMGGSVAGGKIYGKWPGLRDDQLFEGRDLAVTTDLRSVLGTVAEAQLGVRDLAALFPGFTGGPLQGLLRT